MRAQSADGWKKHGAEAQRALGDGSRQLVECVREQATLESEPEIAVLRLEGQTLEADAQRCIAGLGERAAMSVWEARLKFFGGAIWFLATVCLVVAGYELGLSTLTFLGGFENSKHLLAAVLAVATSIAFEEFIRRLAKVLSPHLFRVVLLSISIVPVLSLLAAVLSMAVMRSDYASVQQAIALQDSASVTIDGAVSAETSPPAQGAIADFYRRSRLLTLALTFLAAIGLEIIAALALHEAQARIFPALVVLGEQRRLKQLRAKILECARASEQWTQNPKLAVGAFIQGALLEKGRILQRRIVAMVVSIALFLAMLLVFGSMARAEESVIVALDLSTSSAEREFEQNAAAIEHVIGQLRPGSRFAVIPINTQSFASPVILNARLSTERGLFDERSQAGRRALANVWKQRAKNLGASAKQTDIFGALLKAAVLRDENPTTQTRLVLFSDMRQWGRGYSFELPTAMDASLLDRVERDGLIPSLKGIDVWVLGAHGVGIPDTYWLRLRTFWTEYFRKAGATLKAFSPERRWNCE